MITAFMSAGELHAVHMIHQKGLTKIHAISMCKTDDSIGQGIFQVPLWVFDGRSKYGETVVCEKCSRTVTMMREPPR